MAWIKLIKSLGDAQDNLHFVWYQMSNLNVEFLHTELQVLVGWSNSTFAAHWLVDQQSFVRTFVKHPRVYKP